MKTLPAIGMPKQKLIPALAFAGLLVVPLRAAEPVVDQFMESVHSLAEHRPETIYFIPEIVTAADREGDPFAQPGDGAKGPSLFAKGFAKLSGSEMARFLSLLEKETQANKGEEEYGQSYQAIFLRKEAPAIILQFRKVKGAWYLVTELRDAKGGTIGSAHRKCSPDFGRFIDDALVGLELSVTARKSGE